jgi:hypothetical protein
MVRTGLVAMVRGSGHFTGFPPERTGEETDEDVTELAYAGNGNGHGEDDAPFVRRLGM